LAVLLHGSYVVGKRVNGVISPLKKCGSVIRLTLRSSGNVGQRSTKINSKAKMSLYVIKHHTMMFGGIEV
jgi:hypothetical protein